MILGSCSSTFETRSCSAGGTSPAPSHGRINERNLASYPPDALFVTYCAGPHCNGADKAALKLAQLGRPVKKMIGGVEGWRDEGFALVADD